MSIKDFRGQVKVSDVQNAFDEIVGRINSQVEVYNGFYELEDYDITKGSPLLGAANYSLSVGGLKSVLNSYNGTVIGCKIFRLDEDRVLASDGFCIYDNQVHRINAHIIGDTSTPDVRPTPSSSYYSYSCSPEGGYYDYAIAITNKSDNLVEGATFNHLNSVPFEFDKVYRLPAMNQVQYSTHDAAAGPVKFGYYNGTLDKVVPSASFNDSMGIVRLTLGSDGDVTLNSTSNISYQAGGSIPQWDDQTDSAMYIQKVRDGDKIKLYVSKYYSYYSSGGHESSMYVNSVIQDSESSNEFTDLMNMCEYLVYCANSNTDETSSFPYYDIGSSTLDQITSKADLGDASYYSNSRPSSGRGVDVSEVYYNTETESLIFKAWRTNNGVAYVIPAENGEYNISLNDEIVQEGGIVKISYLNWDGKDVVLNGIKDLQIEGTGLKLYTQNRYIPHEGHVWETLNTSDGGKFTTYVIRNVTNAGSTGGYCRFMGVDLINSYHSESGLYRKHWGTHPISLIYIPNGFNPTVVHSGAVGQYIYNYTLENE